MKLASYKLPAQPTWGVIEGNEAIHVGKILSASYPDLKSLIAADAFDKVDGAISLSERSPLTELTWLPVVPNPDKILCVGLNYETHRNETGRAEVKHPTIFGRFANTQTAHLADIVRPRVSSDLDFEGELAIVIGKRGRYIKPEDAFDHIAGYSCYNDASLRDWQYHTHQFTPGKNFPDRLLRSLDGHTRRIGRSRGTPHHNPPERGNCAARSLGPDDLQYPNRDCILLFLQLTRARRRNPHGNPRGSGCEAYSSSLDEAG